MLIEKIFSPGVKPLEIINIFIQVLDKDLEI